MFTRFTFILLVVMTLYSGAAPCLTFDYSLTLPFRSFPLAGGLAAIGGANMSLWGEKTPGAWKYGYLRGVATAGSSGRTHLLDGAIQLAPVSFLILEAGRNESLRNTNFFTADCASNQCQGTLHRDYTRAFVAFGAPAVFFTLSAKRTFLRTDQSAVDFVDEFSVLKGKAGGDLLFTYEYAMGHQFNEHWTAAFLKIEEHMQDSGDSSRFFGGVARYKKLPWIFALGLGGFESSTVGLGPSVFGGIKWVGLPSLGLE